MTQDLEKLKEWIGQTESDIDYVTVPAVHRLAATLDRADPMPKMGDSLPAGWHQILFPRVVRHSQIGADGHPERGDFLPPVPLPRRMWAGGQIEFVDPLRVGDTVTRSSRITDVTLKTGSTGALCFVAVDHTITTPRGVAIKERHDIVYRDIAPAGDTNAAPAKAPPPAPAAKHRESHPADPVLLFRYSALTFNGHRIHYDRDYVTKVEGYPGLIVHGPLQASLLIEFAAKLRGHKAPAKFVYRGVQPLFDGAEFSVNANEVAGGLETWTANAAGAATMKGTASW